MEARSFSSNMPGELVTTIDNELAFLPHPLPPKDWEFPSSLWPLLSETKRYIGELEGIGSVLPNPAILLRPISDREAIRSSRLEGTYASPKELLLFELAPTSASPESDRTQEFREVWNYSQALQHGIASDLPLSLRLLREMHGILLSGVRGRDMTPGEFRKIQVAIGATRRFVPPPPERLNECLDSLEKYFHAETTLDPLVLSFLIHYQIETIQPLSMATAVSGGSSWPLCCNSAAGFPSRGSTLASSSNAIAMTTPAASSM